MYKQNGPQPLAPEVDALNTGPAGAHWYDSIDELPGYPYYY